MSSWSYVFDINGSGTIGATAGTVSGTGAVAITGSASIGASAGTVSSLATPIVAPPPGLGIPGNPCVAQGWGTGPWGTSPWGGGFGASPGGTIPSIAPYDIYCVGPCGPMSYFLTYDEVDEVGDALQLLTEGTSLDLVVTSGGAVSTDTAYVTVTTSVPENFTFEYTAKFDVLPQNFTDLVNKHIFIGLTDAAGPCVGLFFSRVGIAYAGAIHHTAGDLVLDSSIQFLPDSQTMISEGEYYTLRIAANLSLGAVYIYITKTIDLPLIGHQLRFILPVITADDLTTPATDRTVVSVRGSLGSPSTLCLDSMCLSSAFLIPNIPPVADAGLDQAARLCSIIQLDGTKSFDPEGVEVTYRWRLIDAPLGSKFVYDGGAGNTIPLPVPTGFTNKFYSTELALLDATDPLVAGEVLVVSGVIYDVVSVGTDVDGFYVQVDGYELPDNLTAVTYKYLRQRGISGRTQAKPTFLPDIPGLFKFDLIVSDGETFSFPAVMAASITESSVPRGIIPDLRFLWNYLSDFYRLVEDKERIETFWGAMAQTAAAELFNLWQIDYSKSLRDVQRTFQRRWLNYNTLVKEVLPDLAEVTIGPYSGVTSAAVLSSSIAAETTQLELSSPVLPNGALVTIAGSNPVSLTSVVAQLNGALRAVHSGFTVTLIESTAGTEWYVRVSAPFPFTVESSSIPGVFSGGETNGALSGIGGLSVGGYAYKVETSLAGIGVGSTQFLVVDDVAYRIRSVISDPSDSLPSQRIVTQDPLPLLMGARWSVGSTVESESLEFHTALLADGDTLTFEVVDEDSQEAISLEARAYGAASSNKKIAIFDGAELGKYVALGNYSISFLSMKRKKYLPIDDLVVDIPYLQEKVKSTNDQEVLRRNIDFFLESFRGQNCIRFVTGSSPDPDVWEYQAPPDTLWAELTYLDNNPTIEQNFGFPAGFTLDDLSKLPSNVDYLSCIRGLWYSFFKGPVVFNLRVGVQILLGLPFAEEAGTITELRDDFSSTQGRILIQDSLNPEITRSYTYPVALEMEINPDTGEAYKVGDTVKQFAPLVTGAEVLDYVKDPSWFEGLMNQGLFYEPEKFFRFLVRVDSAAFNLSALLFVKSFILRIKPTYTYPLFVVQRTIKETEVSTTDDIETAGVLSLFDGTCTQYNNITTWGVATMLDEPDPSGGGWQSQLDSDSDPATAAPVYPVAQGTLWGIDRNLLCPEDYILGTCTLTLGAPATPTLDSIFTLDQEIFQGTAAMLFEDSDITNIPAGATGLELFGPGTVATTQTITDVEVVFDGFHEDALPIPYFFDIIVNGGAPTTVTVTPPADGHTVYQTTVSIPVTAGDTITVFVRHGNAESVKTWWETVMVKLGQATPWALDTSLPAGTYRAYRDL